MKDLRDPKDLTIHDVQPMGDDNRVLYFATTNQGPEKVDLIAL